MNTDTRDQTAASLSTRSMSAKELSVSPDDVKVLRELAAHLSEIASLPEQKEKRTLWYAHNALEKTRPLVFCDPENGWNEIIPFSEMRCRGRLASEWEMVLRKEIYWGQTMGDDKVVDAVFNVSHVFEESDWGFPHRPRRASANGSYHWDPPLTDYGMMDVLHSPKIIVDVEASDKVMEIAREIFAGLLDVRRKTAWWWTLGMTWTLINLRGMQQMMIDMYDHPKELHRLMAILRDGHLAKLDYLEQNGLLFSNTDNTYVGSGGFGFTEELHSSGHVRTADMWGFCESQETVGISPKLFEEFIFPYQYPIMERFGLNCYGCCEPLDLRWKVIRNFPRLRRISVSNWADIAKMVDHLEDRYIFSYKPLPTDLAGGRFDEERIRRKLMTFFQQTRNCRVEIIMKDNHTFGGRPENAADWCRVAREEAESQFR